uniref:RNA polymerase sigma factor n=1 Tax=Prevotella sp. TaxID=59823 RepID=UPI0040299063
MMQEAKIQDNHSLAQMEFLYKKFYVRLHRYALTFLGDEDEATDVVGEVFLQIWESWQVGATINERKNIAAYLYTRVRNSCLDHLRHRKAIDNYNTFLKATSPFTTDAEVEDFEKRITRLREAIENLPPSDRRVLKAVYFEHLSYKEAAERLEMSENMIHKHMTKAFRQLREMSKNYDYVLLLLISSTWLTR